MLTRSVEIDASFENAQPLLGRGCLSQSGAGAALKPGRRGPAAGSLASLSDFRRGLAILRG